MSRHGRDYDAARCYARLLSPETRSNVSQFLSSAGYSAGKQSTSVMSSVRTNGTASCTYLFAPVLHAFFTLGLTLLSVEEEESIESPKHAWRRNLKTAKCGRGREMLTTKDADAHYNIHPNGQVVRISDILLACSINPTVVGSTSSRTLGHVEPSKQFEETYSLSAVHPAPKSFRCIQTFWEASQ